VLCLSEAEAEELHHEAIERLSRTRLRPELARAHLLYGEWLRREGRRLDAREQLRAAYDMFATIGMEAFAERARRELLATGDKVRKRSDETRGQLTPQEEQIARLAREASRIRRSARSSSSVRARSSGTCARCSRSSGSTPVGSSRTDCQAPTPKSSRPKLRRREAPRRHAVRDARIIMVHARARIPEHECTLRW
jgi:hypothetical protein